MPFQFKVGRFQLPVSADASTTSYTGVGFQPKALFLSAASVNTNTFEGDTQYQWGFASSVADQRSMGWSQSDGAGVSDTQSVTCDTDIWSDGYAGLVGNMELQSFDSDGFTLNIPSNRGNQWNIGYLALGGDDLAGAKAGTFITPSSTGLHAVTGVGFIPDFVLLLMTGQIAADENTTDFIGSESFGCFNGVGEQACCSFGAEDNISTMDTARYQRTDKCLAYVDDCDVSLITHEAEFSTMDSDGFTLNFTTANESCVGNGGPGPGGGFLEMLVYYLAIKGPQTKIGSFTSPTAGTIPVSQSITGVGFTPQALIDWSVGKTAGTSIVAHSRYAVGGANNSTSRWCNWSAMEDATGNAVTAKRADSNKIMRISTAVASAGSSTTQALADFSSFDSDGFTLNWTVIDAANAYEIIYLAFADALAPPPITSRADSTSNQFQTFTELSSTNAESEGADTIHY